LTRGPWIRLPLGYTCREPAVGGETSIQSNLVRPAAVRCAHCCVQIAVSEEAPSLRLVT